jgi:hypothetical protein
MHNGVGAHINGQMSLVFFRSVETEKQSSLRIDLPRPKQMKNTFVMEVGIPSMRTSSIVVLFISQRNLYS